MLPIMSYTMKTHSKLCPYSTVHAAYASFLWDIEEAGEKEAAAAAKVGLPPLFRHGIIASATA